MHAPGKQQTKQTFDMRNCNYGSSNSAVLYSSDPSIEGETPFKSSPSSDEIFCQEMSNEPGTRTTLNIKEQLHYGVWREIEEIYKGLKITAKNLS